jgi:hypothetical protein
MVSPQFTSELRSNGDSFPSRMVTLSGNGLPRPRRVDSVHQIAGIFVGTNIALMSKRQRPPSTQLQLRPGEDLLSAAIRELSANPSSPASLKIQSTFRQAMEPAHKAIEQLVGALAAQALDDGVFQLADVNAAVAHWERTSGTTMTPELLMEFRKDAAERAKRLQRQPPSMQSVLDTTPGQTDTGYRLGIHLEGVEGTWHRLWASIALCFSFGGEPDSDDTVKVVREQFEHLFGRALTAQEYSKLRDHGRIHAERHMPRAEG